MSQSTKKKWPRRYKFLVGAPLAVMAYQGYQYYIQPSFEEKVRLVFPDYKQKGGVVKVLSENQIQYLLRKCSEEGKTLAPLELSKTVQADVYYDASEMNKVLKLCKKNQYVKVQPGITLLDLGNTISKELARWNRKYSNLGQSKTFYSCYHA